MKKNLKIGSLVEISWFDTTSCDNWIDENDVLEFKPKKIKSWGVLIEVDKDYLKTITMIASDKTSNVCVFPMGCVETVEVIKDCKLEDFFE